MAMTWVPDLFSGDRTKLDSDSIIAACVEKANK